MKPRINRVLTECIERGIENGYRRAYKYTDTPDENHMKDEIEQAIWNELYEWFEFESSDEESI